MKKTIIKISISIASTILFISCSGSEKLDEGRKQADFIIDNLDNPNIAEKFPNEYFQKSQLFPILNGIREKCDWKNRDGKFIDFFTQSNVGGRDQNSYIYEYYLKCDSIRVILTFDVEEEPKLYNFKIEPLEAENPMILFPEKQLKNR